MVSNEFLEGLDDLLGFLLCSLVIPSRNQLVDTHHVDGLLVPPLDFDQQVTELGVIKGVTRFANQFLPCLGNLCLVRLLPFGIVCQGLRDYCLEQNLAKKVRGEYFYSRQFIKDLSEKWITKKVVMKNQRLTNSTFYKWVQNHQVKTMVIGRTSFVLADDLIRVIRQP